MLIYGLDHLAVARGRMTKALNRVTGGDCPASSYGEALLMNPQLGLFPRGVPQRVPELTEAMRLALQWIEWLEGRPLCEHLHFRRTPRDSSLGNFRPPRPRFARLVAGSSSAAKMPFPIRICGQCATSRRRAAVESEVEGDVLERLLRVMAEERKKLAALEAEGQAEG